jgi:spore coat protein U-like protein
MALTAAALAPAARAATTCTLQSASIAFGNYSSSQTLNAVGSISISCNAAATVAVRISAGASGTFSPRRMIGFGGILNCNLYTSSAYTAIWGDTTSGTGQVIGTLAAAGTLNFPVYGMIPSGQTGAGTGTYLDILSVTFAWDSTLSNFVGSGSMYPTANVTTSCTISAGTMAFGSFGLALATTSRSQTTTLSYTCSSGASARITLDQGQNGSGTLAAPARQMKSGNGSLGYQLYSDSGMTTVWDGVNGVSITGTGSAQTSTVYGKVPAQPVPPAGTYTDTVVVTITF